jgi:hypothetical protein
MKLLPRLLKLQINLKLTGSLNEYFYFNTLARANNNDVINDLLIYE